MPVTGHESPGTASAAAGAAVRAAGVHRSFGATRALRGVSLDLHGGRIHALVGENGAGKSTFLGILAGRIAPTSGTVHAFGEPLHAGSPRAARAAGIVAIYQELTTVPARSACENVFLGQPLRRGPLADDRAMRTRFEALCAELHVDIPADAPAGSLSVADRQLLEIMRALCAGARVMLFDEPTAALAPRERASLFALMRGLRDRGVALAFVSHNLDEVLELSDDVSVFRDGTLVASAAAGAWDKRALVTAMLGRELDERLHAHDAPVARRRETVLRAEGLAVPGLLFPTDLELRAGEVLGVAGLVGSGRSSLLRALAGAERGTLGTLHVDGQTVPAPRSPRAARALGIAFVPEDRKAQGLVPAQSAATNVVLSDLGAVARLGVASRARARRRAAWAATPYGFDPRRLAAPAGSLSGGNQQKLLLARTRHCAPRVLLADEPTRGIDVGAKAEILAALRAAALEEGLAVMLVSSELEEIEAIADRVLVLRDGRVVDQLDAGAGHVGVARMLRSAFGVEHAGDVGALVGGAG